MPFLAPHALLLPLIIVRHEVHVFTHGRVTENIPCVVASNPKLYFLLAANCPKRVSSASLGYLPSRVSISTFSTHIDCEEYGRYFTISSSVVSESRSAVYSIRTWTIFQLSMRIPTPEIAPANNRLILMLFTKPSSSDQIILLGLLKRSFNIPHAHSCPASGGRITHDSVASLDFQLQYYIG